MRGRVRRLLPIAPSERDFGDVQIQTEAPVQRFTVTSMGAGVCA
jgi:hypothetical protein